MIQNYIAVIPKVVMTAKSFLTEKSGTILSSSSIYALSSSCNHTSFYGKYQENGSKLCADNDVEVTKVTFNCLLSCPSLACSCFCSLTLAWWKTLCLLQSLKWIEYGNYASVLYLFFIQTRFFCFTQKEGTPTWRSSNWSSFLFLQFWAATLDMDLLVFLLCFTIFQVFFTLFLSISYPIVSPCFCRDGGCLWFGVAAPPWTGVCSRSPALRLGQKQYHHRHHHNCYHHPSPTSNHNLELIHASLNHHLLVEGRESQIRSQPIIPRQGLVTHLVSMRALFAVNLCIREEKTCCCLLQSLVLCPQQQRVVISEQEEI